MKKVLLGVFAFFLIISIAAVGVYATYDSVVNSDGIYSGISINGVDVSRLSKEEALEKLKEEDKNIDGVVKLKYKDEEFSYPFSDLGYNPDYEKAVEEAYEIGRSGTPGDRFKVVTELKKNPVDIKTDQGFLEENVVEVVNHIEDVVNIPPTNAKFSFVNGEVIITEEQAGISLDRQKTKDAILSFKPDDEPIEVPTVVKEAEIKKDYFAALKGDIGNFSTNYSSSVQNRKDNIKLAASIIDGTLIMPGQQISFNNIIGEISANTGFKPATVILDGEYETGTGGGICQVSTTLYNAAVRADLQIDERRNHSRPVNYVPMGLDAAVASGFLDLKVTNPFDFPVYIRATADNDNINFSIIGDTDKKDYNIELVSERTGVLNNETINKYNNNMPKGSSEVIQSGNTGYQYTSYKIVSKNGEVVSKDNFLNSYYPARDTIVSIGTMETSSDVEEGGN